MQCLAVAVPLELQIISQHHRLADDLDDGPLDLAEAIVEFEIRRGLVGDEDGEVAALAGCPVGYGEVDGAVSHLKMVRGVIRERGEKIVSRGTGLGSGGLHASFHQAANEFYQSLVTTGRTFPTTNPNIVLSYPFIRGGSYVLGPSRARKVEAVIDKEQAGP